MRRLKYLFDGFLDYLKSLNYSDGSIESHYYNGSIFLRYLDGNFNVKSADELRKEHLFSWQKYLSSECKTYKGYPIKARTINIKISSAKVFLKYLSEKGYVLKSLSEVLRHVKEPKMLPLGVIKHSLAKKILSEINTSMPAGYRDRAMLELMYSSGLRAGEVVNMNVRSVDFNNATVTVFGKGRKERVVPVGKTALRCLETYINAVRPFLRKNKDEQALFLNRYGSRMRYYSILKQAHKHCDSAKTDETITPHTFRRSCATEMIRGGANLYHVKDILGHESIETLKYYTKLTITDLKKTHRKCHPRERDN